MAFAVICKSCQARFLLNDDLLRRKVAGKVVTVRCRQCHATIEVDASDVDPKKVQEAEKALVSPTATPTPSPKPAPVAPTAAAVKAPRPAPAPPRPPAKSTLMGIGAPRPQGATELVALSPGLLEVGRSGSAAKLAPQGFPEPPPPPPALRPAIAKIALKPAAPPPVETLDENDWEIAETPAIGKLDAAPESIDDFIEELPASIPPEEELPSSTGTPSLKALTHHDQATGKPRMDDFLANMSPAMNGGNMGGAPTIDVSTLNAPRTGKQTLPLFGIDDEITTLRAPTGAEDITTFRTPVGGEEVTALRAPTSEELTALRSANSEPAEPKIVLRETGKAAAPKPPARTGTLPLVESAAPSPASLELKAPTSERSSAPRSRRNVIAPATKSVPPPAPEKQRSMLAVPLLIVVAAAAGFLMWKRSQAVANVDALAHAEQTVAPPAVPTPPAAAVTPAEPVAAAAPPTVAEAPADDVTFEVAKQGAPPTRDPSAANSRPASPSAPTADKPEPSKPESAKPEPSKPETPKPTTKEEPKPEPTPAREPSGEPAGPFDRSAAAAALTSSAAQASSCRKDGDPSGVASVVVTFAPSGRVTSANISGPPFAGTPTGGCIAAALRKSRIPPFEGDRVTVSKTVVIQ
jgi:predicted Zn finger-like uncharacterized protein